MGRDIKYLASSVAARHAITHHNKFAFKNKASHRIRMSMLSISGCWLQVFGFDLAITVLFETCRKFVGVHDGLPNPTKTFGAFSCACRLAPAATGYACSTPSASMARASRRG